MNGVTLGYSSVLYGSLIHALVIYISFEIADIYGIAMVALGIVSMLPSYLTICKFMTIFI